MEERIARDLSRKVGISTEQIVREEYELIILKRIFESEFGKDIVFKGGTALRLGYGSPRFSEDLDFSAIKALNIEGLTIIFRSIAKEFAEISVDEIYKKRFTFLSQYRVRETYLPQSFSIKVEISTRPRNLIEGRDFELKLLRSETTPLSVLAQVATLSYIWEDKEDAFKRRKLPRDLFDLWFISQLEKKSWNLDTTEFKNREIKGELHKFLPRSYWRVVDRWGS
ncbi:MAG: nucleotidyl transferase AbiEii/AbiGii toxin family protein [Actinomycetota bacterium]